MLRRINAEFIAVLLLALARSAVCCYRAAHQSIVIDEAFTFNRYVNGPWENIHAQYDASNHVLYSILAKLSIQTFGLSEFTFRLPSLIAGFAFVVGAYLVLEWISSSLIRWIALAALSLHPLLLDFSIAARGYGLAIALLTWALVFTMRKRYLAVGTMLGLAVSANLTMAFPALALMFSAIICERGRLADRLKILWPMIATAETIVVILCFLPLRTAERRHFTAGYTNIAGSLNDLVYNSLRGGHNSGIIGNYRGVYVFQNFVLPALAVFILYVSAAQFVRKREDSARWIPAVTLFTSAVGIWLSHAILGLNYPIDRTGLYLCVLLGLAWALATGSVSNRAVRWVQIALAVVLIAQFATQFRMRYFQLWMFDMDTRRIAAMLKESTAGRADNTVKVSATWIHAAALQFYRESLKINPLEPVERREPTVLSGADYFVLSEPDTNDPAVKAMIVLFRGRQSGVILAVPNGGR